MQEPKTGVFNDTMKDYFGAEEGAYTSCTASELDRRTFNVKSVIKQLLEKRIGKDNIPRTGITTQQTIRFNVCSKAKIYEVDQMDIACKYSKPDKNEMSIYLTEIIHLFNMKTFDKWYVYYTSDSEYPVIGVMSKDKWDDLFDEVEDNEHQEPDEVEEKELVYSGTVEGMNIIETEAPARETVQKTDKKKIIRSTSAEEAARKEKNRKTKGNRGEEIAIEIEKRRLNLIDRNDLIPKITHVAKYKDGLGYDIISTDVDESGEEKEIYIEVKSTAGNINMPFYVSQRELEVSQKYKELYYIYRIFNMKEHGKDVNYYRLNGSIDENYDLINVDYLAYRSKKNK